MLMLKYHECFDGCLSLTFHSWRINVFHPFRCKGYENVGVTNVEILCANPETASKTTTTSATTATAGETATGSSGYDSSKLTRLSTGMSSTASGSKVWSTDTTCGPHQVVCGLQTRTTIEGFWTDDAGVTDIRIRCCPYRSGYLWPPF